MHFILVNKTYLNLIQSIQSSFKNSTQSIHKARNEIKVINYKNQNLIIKSFKIPHIINRVIYSFFRDSKAKKSYNYSIKISNFVPKAIGYVELKKYGLLHESYFISEHFNYDFTIREPLLNANFSQKKEILEAFSKFTFELHENKILHQDYSPGNILIKKENDKFIFKIVDINRMQFKPLNLNTRLQNFSKLWANDNDLKIIIEAYAKLMQEDAHKCLTIANRFNHKHKEKINAKKRRRGQIVVD